MKKPLNKGGVVLVIIYLLFAGITLFIGKDKSGPIIGNMGYYLLAGFPAVLALGPLAAITGVASLVKAAFVASVAINI